jgi:hypothetical protein
MPFKSSTRGPVLYVSWRGYTREDLEDVAAAAASLRATLGRDVVYLSRIPYDLTMLSPEAHSQIFQFLERILPHCATVHHVIEGDGFVKSARRAIVTNMALATPRARDFYTHSSMTEATGMIASLHQIDVSELASRSPSTRPPERAATAFREAARLAVGRPRR